MITKPMLLDETGQKVVQAIQRITTGMDGTPTTDIVPGSAASVGIEPVIQDDTGRSMVVALNSLAAELFHELGLRMKYRLGTTSYWATQTSDIPLAGELIVYSDYSSEVVNGVTRYIPAFKVGDGLAYVVDLPFVGDDIRNTLNAHIGDTTIHITEAERTFWNNKVRCYMGTEEVSGQVVETENLIFTTN